MLLAGLLASVEHGLNRVLRMDSTALPRLAALEGKVIEIDCRQPALQVFILPDEEGLMLAAHWEGEVDCSLRAPAGSLAQLALAKDKNAVLHSPQVELHGDSAVLLDLVGVLQDLELDWEFELSRWLGPVATSLLAGHLRLRARWTRQGLTRFSQNLSEYLAEESRTLVGKREAEAAFSELDALKVDIERLEARLQRLSRTLDTSDKA
ncbi:SCP2 domain-containing protein [Pseudomonas sp. SWI6]|uniref:ubiquinone biosynthesis accessory factor UbiJ n=1 Tax=Pseudomonas TaxID=286 RepID=UPI00041121F9|nr:MULTISPECIES: SCP2 sterol-binding domain-containing protein [Pseudomonas]AVD85180.1 SCP2 domain-containing protein [Pseudomonas sp. SWI6]AVD87410.1 SCP2 domain-containing protein [Pseudomonas sp. SWI44]MPS97001.1 SCP2 domain-containing protein [Pseudomonas sp.]QQZ36722.1 SCP2 sterol-binding domain-containing protein [Pseudomonas sp. SK2]WEZ89080.1 SCP2 sterol-binding domain-containing protein [Pseudomonas sp. NyZ480]